MKTQAVAFLLGVLVCVLLAPIVLYFAKKYHLHDNSEMERKSHRRAIPRLGGAAIFAAFLIPIIGLYFWDNTISQEIFGDKLRIAGLLALASCAFAIGFADDLFHISARSRLAAQAAIGLFSFAVGFRLETIGLFGDVYVLPFPLSVALTVVWFMLIINAINLIDGLDGLAGGIVLIVTAAVFMLAVSKGSIFMSLMTATLFGSLLGFTYFNFSPARLFMGDGGSYFLGYTIAALTLEASVKTSTVCIILLPLLALGIPIFDTMFAFSRRLWRGIPFSVADKKHIHHRLRDMGFNSRQAVVLLYMATATSCAISLSLALQGGLYWLSAAVVYGIAIVIAIRLAGVRGIANTVLHIVRKYRERRRRFAAVSNACKCAGRGHVFEETCILICQACNVLKCSSVKIRVLEGDSLRDVASWNSPVCGAAPWRTMVIPLLNASRLVGEIEFAVPESLSDVFNRDKDYFNSLARAIGSAIPAESPKARPIDFPQAVIKAKLHVVGRQTQPVA
ncbi:MAG: MraY family glycosyltransferase [Candidatus Brocadiia bacterium]